MVLHNRSRHGEFHHGFPVVQGRSSSSAPFPLRHFWLCTIFPSALLDLHRCLGTLWPSFHLQCETWAPKCMCPRETLVFHGLKSREVSADLQVACSGCWMQLGDVLLFLFFPLSCFPPPSHIAVSGSAGHLPTFEQQLHKNSFFFLEFRPAADVWPSAVIANKRGGDVYSHRGLCRGCRPPGLPCRWGCQRFPWPAGPFSWVWIYFLGWRGGALLLTPHRAGGPLGRGQQTPKWPNPAKLYKNPEFPMQLFSPF